MVNRPYAESCDENKQVILDVLKQMFCEPGNLLEIGSGTGQHAVFFTENMPHIIWQPSDMEDQIEGIKLWMKDANHERILLPEVLNVSEAIWSFKNMDYAFTANTTHIMSWQHVVNMFQGIGEVLRSGGRFAQYGPFNYNGQYTSESNARFDVWLKNRDAVSGIRDFEALEKLAAENDMVLFKDYEMPANNRILVWQKK